MSKLRTLIKATAWPITHNGTPAVSNVQIVARAAQIYMQAAQEIKEVEEVGGDIYPLIKNLEFELMLLEKEIV